MIKNIVLQHQQEKKELLACQYIPRDQLNEAKKLLKSRKFAYLNFDDEDLLKAKGYN